jgi:hypothetical protein
MRTGYLSARISDSDSIGNMIVEDTGEEFESNRIPLKPNEFGGVVGLTYPEWVKLFCYELMDFETLAGSVVVCPVSRVNQSILLEKTTLSVFGDRDYASVELDVKDDKIRGRLIYSKRSSRGVRVEIVARYNLSPLIVGPQRTVFRKKIVEVRESGNFEFEYDLPNVKDVFVVLFSGDVNMSLRRLIKTLGLDYPVVFGTGWKQVDASVKLVLDFPKKPDVVDTTKMTVKIERTNI